MVRFQINYENVREGHFLQIRAFCKGKGIRVTKAKIDDLFINEGRVTVSCENKRGANKVRDFIWEELNGGAYCEVSKL